MKRKLILYIACSVDGYIAKPNDDLSFLELVQKEGEDYGYNAFINTVDTVVVGRKTYDWVKAHTEEFPHANKETYVITHRTDIKDGNVHFYDGDLATLIKNLKQKPGKNIFCDGGAKLANQLMRLGLIDEFIISVVPILLGKGTKLFEEMRPEQRLKLKRSQSFSTGLTQLHYAYGS